MPHNDRELRNQSDTSNLLISAALIRSASDNPRLNDSDFEYRQAVNS